ncbi:MAG: hypothetical protein MJZ26_12225 [Fibrobacter sp.]|nr:hypothetical protein [Fibrobacter sp.]
MARIQSLAVLASGGGNDYLAELYGKVIANIQKNGISNKVKNTALSGTPSSGTVEAKRFENRTSNAYGTARTGGAGQKAKATPVVISINQDKELITEIEQKDVSLYGIDAFLAKQADLDEKSMTRELERAFWAEAKTAGTQVTSLPTDPAEIAEKMIQSVETVSNTFVDGVDRDMIALVCTPAFFGKLRTYLDTITDAAGEGISAYHGVKVYSSVYLPAGVTTCIALAEGAVAQPVLMNKISGAQIPLSNAVATEIFYSYGTKAVADDLIFWA